MIQDAGWAEASLDEPTILGWSARAGGGRGARRDESPSGGEGVQRGGV